LAVPEVIMTLPIEEAVLLIDDGLRNEHGNWIFCSVVIPEIA
jgi:hypothetical protein